MEGQEINQIYKGCSSFKISGDIEYEDAILPGEDGKDTGYKMSRTTCSHDNNCNEEHLNVNGDAQIAVCQMCTVTKGILTRTLAVRLHMYACGTAPRGRFEFYLLELS